MDEPLFGGISRREIFIERFANAFIITISLGTVTASLISSVYTGTVLHILLGVCVSLFAAIQVRLVNWYRLGDLEPHFKYMIFALGFAITLLCITANLYFFL
ncbi:hypothetical protein GGI00_002839 [Coemansia sp. RSA 2681]|nr:hypothetical protein GGI00_002839 [Coemansia sp. RSA 2681]KAJ2455294.1 hypothetical protein GGF42_003442 [Coemansia sp. RSA 2424]